MVGWASRSAPTACERPEGPVSGQPSQVVLEENSRTHIRRGQLNESLALARVEGHALDAAFRLERLERLLEETLLDERREAADSNRDLLREGSCQVAPSVVGHGDGDPALLELMIVERESGFGGRLDNAA